MKSHISKVALIATLAFIGVGFAGTQQAQAQVRFKAKAKALCPGCPPHTEFGDERDCQEEADVFGRTCYPAPITQVTETDYVDTDGDCFAETKYERDSNTNKCYTSPILFYNCTNVSYREAGYNI